MLCEEAEEEEEEVSGCPSYLLGHVEVVHNVLLRHKLFPPTENDETLLDLLPAPEGKDLVEKLLQRRHARLLFERDEAFSSVGSTLGVERRGLVHACCNAECLSEHSKNNSVLGGGGGVGVISPSGPLIEL